MKFFLASYPAVLEASLALTLLSRGVRQFVGILSRTCCNRSAVSE